MKVNTTADPKPPEILLGLQPCPKCNFLIGSLAGSVDAVCKNCGFKDPCCE